MSSFSNPQNDFYALRIILASGTAAAPSVVFANDLANGLYWDTAGLHLSGLVLSPAQTQNASVSLPALNIDWSLSSTFRKTLSANSTFTFSNEADGMTIIVALTNTASNYTVTWPSVQWAGGTPPVQTTGAKTDVYTFVKMGSTIYGSVVQNLS